MYEIVFSQSARKAIKRLSRSGAFHESKIKALLALLQSDKELPQKYKDHELKGRFVGIRECHVEFDFLVMYEKDHKLKIVTLLDIGTHSELFG